MKEYTNKDLIVEYKNKGIILSSRLLERQGIEDMETINELKRTHMTRFKIFEAMENTDDVKELKELAAQFEALEFEQQKIWGFTQDRNFHKWFDVPKCTCPKLDNEDAYGTKYRITNGNCPIHGSK